MSKFNFFILGLFTLVIAITFGIHHLVIINKLKNKFYNPLIINDQAFSLTIDEAYFYAPQVQAILKGSLKLKPFNVFEYRNSPSPYISGNLPAIIMAALAKTSGSIYSAFIISDFIFPPIVFLLFFVLVYEITKRYIIALSASLLVLTSHDFLRQLPYLPTAIKNLFNFQNIDRLTFFTRTPQPQISFILVLISLLLYYYYLKKPEFYPAILTGFFSGLLIFTNFFYAFWFFLGIFISFIINLKNKKIRFYFYFLFLSMITITFPFFKEAIMVWQSKSAIPFFQRISMPSRFSFFALIEILFLILATYLAGKKEDKKSFFFISFSFSCFLLLLEPFFIKEELDNFTSHIQIYILNCWFILIFFYILSLIKSYRKLLESIFFIIAIFFVVRTFMMHYQFGQKNFQAYAQNSEEKDLFDWLNMHVSNDAVLLTLSLRENLNITANTKSNIFLPNYTSIIPNEEMINRLIFSYQLFSLEESDLINIFLKKNGNLKAQHWDFDFCGGWYFYYYQKGSLNRYECSIKQKDLTRIIEMFKQQRSINPSGWPYRVDYLLVGPYERRILKKPITEPGLKLIFQNKEFQVYQL